MIHNIHFRCRHFRSLFIDGHVQNSFRVIAAKSTLRRYIYDALRYRSPSLRYATPADAMPTLGPRYSVRRASRQLLMTVRSRHDDAIADSYFGPPPVTAHDYRRLELRRRAGSAAGSVEAAALR